MSSVQVSVEFGGGAELLVSGKKKKHEVNLAQAEEGCWTLSSLLGWIRDNLLEERPELFLRNPDAGTLDLDVRPGILVLVNDADWELVGTTNYEIKMGDRFSFISTLHGG